MLTFLNIASYLSLTRINLNEKVLGATTEVATPSPQIMSEIEFWKKIINDNSTYIDGYLKLATLTKSIGQNDESKRYIELAKKLDPNSLKITDLEDRLK